MSYHLQYSTLVSNALKLRAENTDNPEFYLDHVNKTILFLPSPYSDCVSTVNIDPTTGEIKNTQVGYGDNMDLDAFITIMQRNLVRLSTRDFYIAEESLGDFYKVVDMTPPILLENLNDITFKEQFYFDRESEIFLQVWYAKGEYCVQSVYYGNQQWDITDKLSKLLAKYRVPSKETHMGVMAKNQSGAITLHVFDVNYDEIDLSFHYGEDFIDFHEKVVDSLTNKHRGVVLMHGLPGTGKSNYIKYLASLVPDKQFIYVPLTYISFLGSPDAVSFLSRHTNSIFVIEDCEQYIKSRAGGSGSAVADILNLSDGILSDLAKCQIICTFNSNIGEVDKALLREGRLIGEHYFDKITVDGEKMTLAEYFNQDTKAVRKVQEKPKFGFI